MLHQDCSQCGETNEFTKLERTRGGFGVSHRRFDCDNCGATGHIVHHKNAGVCGYQGPYFNE